MDDSTQRHLLQLPDEVLGHIVSYLPLLQLAHVRMVCSRLHYLIDKSSLSHSLWREGSLENTWASPITLAVMERGARHGNLEALIKLAIAYLYSQGVPDGPGKGTVHALNGMRAANYLKRAEAILKHRQPFSWVLIRPPFASTCVCCKASVCQNMKRHCMSAHSEDLIHSLFYVVGKAMSHYESYVEERIQAYHWFKQGTKYNCPYSRFETWKAQRHTQDEVQLVRDLRKIVSSSNNRYTCIDAQFELGKLYAQGHYGGSTRSFAYQFIKEHIIKGSPMILSGAVFDAKPDMTLDMIFILIDWLVEVADMKGFSTRTLHLAINLVQRYILARKLKRTRLQLLGVTALLIAARWTAVTIITIREAAWLTDNTYGYDEVVCMLGEIVGALQGDLQRPIIPDYLELYATLANVDRKTTHLAAYLSEIAVIFPEFGKYTVAHLAAACFLLARILLKQELPWSNMMVEATGLTVSCLYECILLLYRKCLTDQTTVVDYRGVELLAIKTRYADERFLSVSQIKFMSIKVVKERLGVLPSLLKDISYSPSHIVTQSFVDDFDAQTLSDSLLPQTLSDSLLPQVAPSDSISPLPQALSSSQLLSPDCYRSPRASIDPPSLIVFDTSSSSFSSSPSSSPSSDRSSNNSFQLLSPPTSHRSSSLPLLHGIIPLTKEEEENHTHFNNQPLLHNTIKNSLQKLNSDSKIQNHSLSSKPLASLTNRFRPATAIGSHRLRTVTAEKRTISNDCNNHLIRNKRPRSTNNLS